MVNNRGRGERGVSREAQHGWLESLEQSSWETLDHALPSLGHSISRLRVHLVRPFDTRSDEQKTHVFELLAAPESCRQAEVVWLRRGGWLGGVLSS